MVCCNCGYQKVEIINLVKTTPKKHGKYYPHDIPLHHMYAGWKGEVIKNTKS